MSKPNPYTEEWWDWKRNRKPGETYEEYVRRVKLEEMRDSQKEEPEDG